VQHGRQLLAGQALSAPLPQPLEVELGAAVQHDHGGDRLGPLLAGRADDAGLGDGRVRGERVSTSAQYAFSPPVMIMFFLRSTT